LRGFLKKDLGMGRKVGRRFNIGKEERNSLFWGGHFWEFLGELGRGFLLGTFVGGKKRWEFWKRSFLSVFKGVSGLGGIVLALPKFLQEVCRFSKVLNFLFLGTFFKEG